MERERGEDKEINIFENFVELSPLNISPESVEKRYPPEPDILCRVDDSPVYFELTEIIDEGVANSVFGYEQNVVWFGDPLQESVREKFQKEYELKKTDAVHLLCFFKAFGELKDVCDFEKCKDFVLENIDDNMFSTVWIMDNDDGQLIKLGFSD